MSILKKCPSERSAASFTSVLVTFLSTLILFSCTDSSDNPTASSLPAEPASNYKIKIPGKQGKFVNNINEGTELSVIAFMFDVQNPKLVAPVNEYDELKSLFKIVSVDNIQQMLQILNKSEYVDERIVPLKNMLTDYLNDIQTHNTVVQQNLAHEIQTIKADIEEDISKHAKRRAIYDEMLKFVAVEKTQHETLSAQLLAMKNDNEELLRALNEQTKEVMQSINMNKHNYKNKEGKEYSIISVFFNDAKDFSIEGEDKFTEHLAAVNSGEMPESSIVTIENTRYQIPYNLTMLPEPLKQKSDYYDQLMDKFIIYAKSDRLTRRARGKMYPAGQLLVDAIAADKAFNLKKSEAEKQFGEVHFDRFISGVEYDNRKLAEMENAIEDDSSFRKYFVSKALLKKTRRAYSQIKDNLEGASFLYLAALFDRIPHQLKLEEGEFDIPNNTSAMIVLGKGHITGRNGQTRPIMVSITYELFNEKALQTDEVVVTASRLKLANPYKTIGYVSEMITDIQKI